MKVLLVGNFAPDRQESMLRFGRMLAAGLPAHGVEPVLIAPEPRLTRGLNYRYGGWKKYVGYADKFLLFPRELRRAAARHQPDVVHILDQGNSPYAEVVDEYPVLITCHDLLQIRAARGEIPHHRPGRGARWMQQWILRHLARAPDVVCISRQTRADLLRLSGRPANRTHVIHNGLNFSYAPLPPNAADRELDPIFGRRARAGGGFYLNVGGGQWYKNRAGLLKIFAELRRRLSPAPELVMIGKPLSDTDAAQARALGVTGAIRHFTTVSNDQLAAFYRLARGLIFPSWEEGFGWPIAEAQACGCPVFTSNRAPMTEVGGDAAVYFDPAQPVEAAQRIVESRADETTLRARGLAYAERWAPERMLAGYVTLYRKLAGLPDEDTARH